jgi:hypothetical protein
MRPLQLWSTLLIAKPTLFRYPKPSSSYYTFTMATTGIQPDHVNDNQARHALVRSWFLGPQAENVGVLKELLNEALDHQGQTRVDFAKAHEDNDLFITQGMKDLNIYQNSINTLFKNTRKLSKNLAKHSVPFWSPRYNAHMNMDTTMASIIGCKSKFAQLLKHAYLTPVT